MDLCMYVWVVLVAHLCPVSLAVGNTGTVFPQARTLTEIS